MPALIYLRIWCHALWRRQENTVLVPSDNLLQRLTYTLFFSNCEITVNTQLVK